MFEKRKKIDYVNSIKLKVQERMMTIILWFSIYEARCNLKDIDECLQ